MNNFIKNNIKVVLAFIFGVILTASIGVLAAVKLHASQVEYNDTTVENVLNDLYTKANKTFNVDSRSRTTFTIPEGVTKAYVIVSSATAGDDFSTFTFSGSILTSYSQKGYKFSIDNYGSQLRSSIRIYELNLTGASGTVNLSIGGGSGIYRAYTALVVYDN